MTVLCCAGPLLCPFLASLTQLSSPPSPLRSRRLDNDASAIAFEFFPFYSFFIYSRLKIE